MKQMDLPAIQIVKNQEQHNTFICKIPDELIEGVNLQSDALRVLGKFGFYAIVRNKYTGTFFVMGLPYNQHEQVKHVKTLVRNIITEAISLLTEDRRPQLDIEAFVETTTHMTKLHIPLLGWEHKLLTPTDYLDRARNIHDNYMNRPRKKDELESVITTNPKDELPMLEALDDADVDYLCESGLLETSIAKYFDSDVKISGAIEEGCVHRDVENEFIEEKLSLIHI